MCTSKSQSAHNFREGQILLAAAPKGPTRLCSTERKLAVRAGFKKRSSMLHEGIIGDVLGGEMLELANPHEHRSRPSYRSPGRRRLRHVGRPRRVAALSKESFSLRMALVVQLRRGRLG